MAGTTRGHHLCVGLRRRRLKYLAADAVPGRTGLLPYACQLDSGGSPAHSDSRPFNSLAGNRVLVRKLDDAGFGLVEVIIAFFLLAIISVALLPALWNGVIQSSTQATTASATRFLYAVVEQGRESAATAGGASAWCTSIGSAAAKAPASFTATVSACTPDASSLVTLTLTATSNESTPKPLATVTAKVYVP